MLVCMMAWAQRSIYACNADRYCRVVQAPLGLLGDVSLHQSEFVGIFGWIGRCMRHAVVVQNLALEICNLQFVSTSDMSGCAHHVRKFCPEPAGSDLSAILEQPSWTDAAICDVSRTLNQCVRKKY